MNRYTWVIGLLLCALLTGCFKEPDYPATPSIEFKSIRLLPMQTTSLRDFGDSVSLVISFKDGDGDMGLSQRDTLPPYQPLQTNGTANPFYYNYFVKIYKKTAGKFMPVALSTPGFTFNGRYPILNDLGNKTALEGEINYGIQFLYKFGGTLPVLRANDTLRFELQIADRALNLSNTVESAPIVLGRYE